MANSGERKRASETSNKHTRSLLKNLNCFVSKLVALIRLNDFFTNTHHDPCTKKSWWSLIKVLAPGSSLSSCPPLDPQIIIFRSRRIWGCSSVKRIFQIDIFRKRFVRGQAFLRVSRCALILFYTILASCRCLNTGKNFHGLVLLDNQTCPSAFGSCVLQLKWIEC